MRLSLYFTNYLGSCFWGGGCCKIASAHWSFDEINKRNFFIASSFYNFCECFLYPSKSGIPMPLNRSWQQLTELRILTESLNRKHDDIWECYTTIKNDKTCNLIFTLLCRWKLTNYTRQFGTTGNRESILIYRLSAHEKPHDLMLRVLIQQTINSPEFCQN